GTSASGIPFREVTTQNRLPSVFSDLDEGDYFLVASGPKTYNGHAIEPHEPAGGILRVNVSAGQTLKLLDRFCFRLCTGRVTGMVLNDECGEGLGDVPILLSRKNGQHAWPLAYSKPEGYYFFDEVPPGEYVVSLAQEKVSLPDGSIWVPSESGAMEY